MKHVCHSIGEKHESSRCLVEIYTLYIGLVETHAKAVTAFSLSHRHVGWRSRRYQ